MTAIAIPMPAGGSLIPKVGADILSKSILSSAPSLSSGVIGSLLTVAYVATVKGTLPAIEASIDLAEAKINEYNSIKQYTSTLNSLNSRIYKQPEPTVDATLKTKLKANTNVLAPINNIQTAPSKFPNYSEFQNIKVNLGQTGFVSQAKIRSVPISQSAANRKIGELLHNPISAETLTVTIPDYSLDLSDINEQQESDLENWLLLNYISRMGGAKINGELTPLIPSGIDPLSLGITAVPVDWSDLDKGWTFAIGGSQLMSRASLFKGGAATATGTATGTATSGVGTSTGPKPQPPKKNNNPIPAILGLSLGAAAGWGLNNALLNPSTENPEELLIFLGKCALYDGGTAHYEEYLKDKNYYKIADFPIENYDLIINPDPNNTVTPAKFNPQILNIPNESERQKILLGIQALKQGLHEFPAKVPQGLLNVPSNKNQNNNKILPSFAAFTAWFMQQHEELMGSYPLNFKNTEENDDGSTSETNQQIPNIATALTTLLGLGALSATTGMQNLNLNMRNSGTINATNINTQFSNEAINALTNCLGCSTSPTIRNGETPVNTHNPKNMKDFFSNKNIKRQGILDDTTISINEKLEKLQFMTSVVFNSVYKRKSEFEDEEKKMEELVNKVKKFNKEDWENFVKALNDDDNILNKNGVTMSIKEENLDASSNPFKKPSTNT